jgi:hypothetical protein
VRRCSPTGDAMLVFMPSFYGGSDRKGITSEVMGIVPGLLHAGFQNR